MTYPLPPVLAPLPARFAQSAAAIEEATKRFGSPVHVIFPQVIAENVREFQATLAQQPVSSRMFYPHKVNQAKASARAAYQSGIGIDVASPGELASALAAGFSGSQIEATGPKGEGFLRQLLAIGATINADNLWELMKVRELSPGPTPVLLRLAGMPASRFGLTDAQLGEALDIAADSRINLRGFAFHLDSTSIAERAAATLSCLNATGQACARGLRPTVLNIGGGYRQAFSASPSQFQHYVHALLAGLNGAGPALHWPGETFGFARRGGSFGGTPPFHKYGADQPAARWLAELLATPVDGQPLTAALRDSMLELWLEPGKALLDHAGITIATVEFTKPRADGSVLVNLDMSRSMISMADDQEVMLDPIPHYRHPPEAYRAGPIAAFFGGNLCLERDLVTRHLTWLDRLPLPGDQLLFVNTGAYQMDMSAAPALMHPLPPKIVAQEYNGIFQLEPDGS